jgi:glutathione peroxidase
VLAFPCNQFGGQEPGSNPEIKAFAERKGFKGPMFAKTDVNGSNAEPLWTYLKSQQGGMLTSDVKWNFTKFLVDRSGKVVKRYGSTVAPLQIESDIKSLL